MVQQLTQPDQTGYLLGDPFIEVQSVSSSQLMPGLQSVTLSVGTLESDGGYDTYGGAFNVEAVDPVTSVEFYLDPNQTLDPALSIPLGPGVLENELAAMVLTLGPFSSIRVSIRSTSATRRIGRSSRWPPIAKAMFPIPLRVGGQPYWPPNRPPIFGTPMRPRPPTRRRRSAVEFRGHCLYERRHEQYAWRRGDL